MARRVVLGQQNDGTYGLRVSAAGVDAFSGTGDGADFTFNSNWTDIAQINAVGIVNWASSAFVNEASVTVNGYAGFWPDQGYKPFCEIRRLVGGNVVRDDYWSSVLPSGGYVSIKSFGFQGAQGTSTSDQCLFVSYKIAAPSG